MKILFTTALAALIPFAALAQAPGITVTDAYARSANPKSGAAFMTIANESDADCTLAAVAADVTERAELHAHKDEGGVMKMVQVDQIAVPAHGTAVLARGGDHVMLLGLTRPLADGDTVNLTLDLGDCGSVPVAAPVDNARTAAAAAPMQHGDMAKAHAGHGAPAPSH